MPVGWLPRRALPSFPLRAISPPHRLHTDRSADRFSVHTDGPGRRSCKIDELFAIAIPTQRFSAPRSCYTSRIGFTSSLLKIHAKSEVQIRVRRRKLNRLALNFAHRLISSASPNLALPVTRSAPGAQGNVCRVRRSSVETRECLRDTAKTTAPLESDSSHMNPGGTASTLLANRHSAFERHVSGWSTARVRHHNAQTGRALGIDLHEWKVDHAMIHKAGRHASRPT